MNPKEMSVEETRKVIRSYLVPVVDTEKLPLKSALSRILAEELSSPENVPNFNNSAMDGYAFNLSDHIQSEQITLEIIGTSLAGKPYPGSIKKGACIRIMTGAIVPNETDTVIPQENVKLDGNKITFTNNLKVNANVRFSGEDLEKGQKVLDKGHLIRPADLGLIASIGLEEVNVFRKIKVAFFTTGSEIASIDKELQSGQIHDSNRYTIFGMLSRLGLDILDMGSIPDDPARLESALLDASKNADVVITSGGVSVGEADYMKELLAKHGDILSWKIAMKPGRPLAFGKIKNTYYFGLPGNPVAVMVTFYQIVKESILTLMGQTNPKKLPVLEAICIENINKIKGRMEFQRGILFETNDGSWKVKPTPNQSSGVLSSMSLANCFIILEEDEKEVLAGSTVKIQLMDCFI